MLTNELKEAITWMEQSGAKEDYPYPHPMQITLSELRALLALIVAAQRINESAYGLGVIEGEAIIHRVDWKLFLEALTQLENPK